MSLQSISIVSIPVSDQERAKTFYLETLGFSLVVDEDQGDMRWIEIRPPGGGAAITLVNWFPSMPAGSLQGTVLSCDNTDQSYDELKAKGVPFQSAPETAPWGRFATFQDPDGNGWVLVSEMPNP